MNDPLETLFYPFEKGLVDAVPGKSALFMNAAATNALPEDLTCQQYFYPYAASVGAEAEIPSGPFETVFLHTPKNIIETQYLMARALDTLEQGGTFFCAAANDAGGGRLEKLFAEAGLENIQSASKNKARVVWAQKNKELNVAAWKKSGEPQKVCDGTFWSQAGIFGWDKIDAGSALLAKHVKELQGHGADFGCGYGFLSDFVLKNFSVKSLTCIDADYRAVQMCEKNLEGYDIKKKFLWDDLTKASKYLSNLDFIVMNPPFHEGKSVDTDIGLAFIDTASRALHKGGHLWIVANSRLPYEETLEKLFFKTEKVFQGGGFKIFNATK